MAPSRITHKWLHHATVRGSGIFPVDMLRYDSCYPASQEDASKLLDDDYREIRISRTSELKGSTFTVARWQSFGWQCDTSY